MHNMLRWLLVPSLLIAAAGCPDVDVDADEVGTAGPFVEFNPAAKIIPFPNNLLLDRTTGKVAIPEGCNESPASKATREGVLNKLDGFGTYETTMYAQFSEAVDVASFADKVVLYKRASAGAAVDPATSTAIPVLAIPSLAVRYDDGCSAAPTMVTQLNFVPTRPLEQKSTYTVAILKGPTTEDGAALGPSFTFSLIRGETNPVTLDADGNVTNNQTPLSPATAEGLASLQGIDLLWKAHAQALGFLVAKGHARADVLLTWEFNTQTVTDPLDPTVTGSVAAGLGGTLAGITSLTCNKNTTTCPAGIDRAAPPYVLCPGADSNVQCYLKIALGAVAGASGTAIYTTGNGLCAQVNCAAIGDVLAGALVAKQFQTEKTNAFDAAKPIPGPWADPVKPTSTKNENISFLAFVPAAPQTGAGYPAVIFGHGLGSTKTSAFAIAPQLATPQAALGNTTGFITIAIDFVAHASRAVRISDQGTCANVASVPPDATSKPQCFAPFLSPDLANTRDNIRQSILDLHSLRNAIATCGPASCAGTYDGFRFDNTHVSYAGISLGGIMGTTFSSVRDDVKARGLNVPGVGWVDILENTDNLSIRCSLVDGLIAAGILTGDPSSAGATALCLTPAWKEQAGYRQFASIGRWVLDPADGANFTSRLATKRLLIQKVENDEVVPNIATDREAALVGLLAAEAPAACAPGGPAFGPTPSIVLPMMTNKFIKYSNLTATATCPDATGTNQPSPGTRYEHASLLRPAQGFCTMTTTQRCSVDAQCTTAGDTCNVSTVQQGQLGTRRMQTDLITFLHLNK